MKKIGGTNEISNMKGHSMHFLAPVLAYKKTYKTNQIHSMQKIDLAFVMDIT